MEALHSDFSRHYSSSCRVQKHAAFAPWLKYKYSVKACESENRLKAEWAWFLSEWRGERSLKPSSFFLAGEKAACFQAHRPEHSFKRFFYPTAFARLILRKAKSSMSLLPSTQIHPYSAI